MSKKATETALSELHGALATVLRKAIEEREPKIVDLPDANEESGTVSTVVWVRNAAVLNTARQFLKDNDIRADATKNAPLRSLAESLPFEESGDPLGNEGLPH